jgi:pimeloyl-ACP methyl ester carboxylesterase
VDATLAPQVRRVAVREHELSVREWAGRGRDFLLVHGLASNARTWDLVAAKLTEAGHHVVAVDQRGHGLSDKPETGYTFDDVCTDLTALIDVMSLNAPIVCGQSWGGNVVLELAARWPELLSGLVMVDGGFIDLSGAPGVTWEKIAVDLRPPPLAGTPRAQMLERMRGFHRDWDDEQLEMQMANFETMEDGSIRPWLTLDRHMQILRALWEQKPAHLYGRVVTPTLIAVAPAPDSPRMMRKEHEVAEAQASIKNARVRWFHDSIHDIHIDKPDALAGWILDTMDEGFFTFHELGP